MDKHFKGFVYYFLLFALVFIVFLVGVNSNRSDYTQYVYIFQAIPRLPVSDYFERIKNIHGEISFKLLISVFKNISDSATLFFIFFCFTSFVFRFKFFLAFLPKEDIGIALFAFFSHEFLRKDAVQIRNGFASSIVLFSLIFLYKNKRFLFVFLILLASTFQSAAIVALPLVFIGKSFPKLNQMRILFVLSFFSAVFFPLQNVLHILNGKGIIPDIIIGYAESEAYGKKLGLLHPVLFKQIVICFYLLFIRPKYLNKDRSVFLLFCVYLLSTSYYLCFNSISILAGRFGGLLYGVECVLLLKLIPYQNKLNGFIARFIVLLLYLSLLILNYFTFNDLSFTFNWI